MSNIGELNIPIIYGEFELNSFHCAFTSKTNDINIAITTMKQNTFLLICIQSAVYNREEMEEKLKKFDAIIAKSLLIPIK